MSKLAGTLQGVKAVKPHIGPRPPCFEVYASCDTEDLTAVQALKASGATWEQIQEEVDRNLGIDSPLADWQFIRHWRAQCSCWRDK